MTGLVERPRQTAAPHGRRQAIGQRDDGAGGRGVAMQGRQADGTIEGDRPDRARQAADLTVVEQDGLTGCGHGVAVDEQPDEMAGDAPMGAIADAHDDFLTDVTALGVADRVVQPSLERDGLFVHVHEEAWNAGLDPQHLGRLVVQRPWRPHG